MWKAKDSARRSAFIIALALPDIEKVPTVHIPATGLKPMKAHKLTVHKGTEEDHGTTVNKSVTPLTMQNREQMLKVQAPATSLEPMKENKSTVNEATNKDNGITFNEKQKETSKLLTDWEQVKGESIPLFSAIITNSTKAELIANSAILKKNIFSKQPDTEQSIDTGYTDAILLETIALHTIKAKQTRKKFQHFFISVIIITASALLLALMIFIIIILPDAFYKLSFGIIFLIAFSYLGSVQAKNLYRLQGKPYIPSTKFIRYPKKKSKTQDEDMKHMKLIKQDTTSYLQAIKKKTPKRAF